MELRHKVLQRDQRVSELKDQLSAKTKAHDDVKRRLQQLQASAGGEQSTGGGGGAVGRCRSPPPGRAARAAGGKPPAHKGAPVAKGSAFASRDVPTPGTSRVTLIHVIMPS